MKTIEQAIAYCVKNPKKRRIYSGLCSHCREVFFSPFSQMVRYCSNVCAQRKGKAVNCLACSKSFYTGPIRNRKFCSRKCWRVFWRGPNHPQWKGRAISRGYAVIKINNKPISEHRHIMAQHLGRKLYHFETVHHKNGNRSDNRLSNLEIWTRPQPYGQRLSDLISFAVKYYPRELKQALRA